ncbi:hypothetical protein EX895_004350 [Sporisorium graminicola]|uniref:Uncharacterized protein n=1 Tax=Sporisorium graminicola TaxID=280036 RepID=A0A4U7KQP2_9BASI|nr:hypothetical protein EX895_004350 [Sporisorium graminicola]TKY86710.1 hypothetical protein EX895_004350 [Sporisorium graminicola]
MAAATLPLSRSVRVPLSSRQDTNESNRIPDEWGPSSVPPPPQSNIPWDDQVVPALRKKLEAESKDLTKRISRIEDSDLGWTRSRADPNDRRDPRAAQERRMSREVVHHHHQRESSIDQYHNRFVSVRAPSRQRSGDVVSTSFPFDVSESQGGGSAGGHSVPSNDATAKAREKARQIAARKKANQLQQQNQATRDSLMLSTDTTAYGSRQEVESSTDAVPEGEAVAVAGGPAPSLTSFERTRLRTQSTPMRPSLDAIDPDYAAITAASRRAQNQSALDATQSTPSNGSTSRNANANGHQRSDSLSRRKAAAAAAAMDPKLMEEFGPLGATPSPTAKLLRAHQDMDPSSPLSTSSPSMRKRNIQPDAFRSLSKSDQSRYLRESSAPPAFGEFGETSANEFGGSPGSKSVNSWEDEIIPTVARKLQQEQFLRAGKEGRLSRYEGLIDTWDKNGLPLSRSDVIAMQRAKKLQDEQDAQQKKMVEEDEDDGQTLTSGPAAPALHPESSNLSPRDAEAISERSRSRASSRRSQLSTRSYQQHGQQEAVESVPMKTFDRPPEALQAASHPSFAADSRAATASAAVGVTRKEASARHRGDDDVEKSGCCCIVM